MGIFQEYERFIRDFTYNEDLAKTAISIFKGEGNAQIITPNLAQKNTRHVQDVIIASRVMENGLKSIHDGIKKLLSDKQQFSGSLFYFSQYGGSKTQFLNYIFDEIQTKISDCIIIMFNDINELNPLILFDKIKQSTYYTIPKLPRLGNDEEAFSNLISKLEGVSSDIFVELRHSSNLQKAKSISGQIRTTLKNNPDIVKKINELDEVLYSTILIDSESIMKKVQDFMREITEMGIVFLFLYDEVDLWIDETSEGITFSDKFNGLNKVMKLLFQSSQESVKVFHVFACTERVNSIFENNRYNGFSKMSPAASRLIQLYDRSDKITESGCYDGKMDIALAKIASFYSIANNKFMFDEEFLNQLLESISEKFGNSSRRVVNSQIIKLLKTYHVYHGPMKRGLKEWKDNARKYGNLLQEHITPILNQLNIKFERNDVKINPENPSSDKIDGCFINYDMDGKEIKTYSEIKLTGNFKKEKAYQAFQWSQLRKEPIIMIIFCPDSKEDIKKEINTYAIQNGFLPEDTARIKILHIRNPFAFVSIIGVENVMSDHQNLMDFYNTMALWLDMFGNFTDNYHDLKKEIGLSIKLPLISPPVADHKNPLQISNEKADDVPPVQFTNEQSMCIGLLIKLFQEKKFNPSGKLNKSIIEKVNNDFGLGIGDLEQIYEVMQKYNIVIKINPKQVTFQPEIISCDGTNNFLDVCRKYFTSIKGI
jgi:hypothetical protein